MAASGGGGMGSIWPPVRLCPPICPQSEEKNGQNQTFSASFWIFAPSESHFLPSIPPTRKISCAATVSENKLYRNMGSLGESVIYNRKSGAFSESKVCGVITALSGNMVVVIKSKLSCTKRVFLGEITCSI